MDGKRDEITIERPTGPRLTMADPASNGEIVAYSAGRATRRVVSVRPSAKAFAALIALGVILPTIIGLAWLSARANLSAYEAFARTVGPWSTNATGWTVPETTPTTSGSCGGPTATADGTCIYYIDNVSGVDNNTNCKGYLPPVTTSPATMCATLNFAATRYRSGKPDWILFKRGQTHDVSSPSRVIVGGDVGQDATHPLLISAYPLEPVSYDDRPLIETKGLTIPIWFQHQGGNAQIAVIGLRSTNSLWNPASPNYWSSVPKRYEDIPFRLISSKINFFLWEDNECTYATCGIQLNDGSGVPPTNLYVRRSVFDNDAPPVVALGGLTGRVGKLFEENLFKKNYTNRYDGASSVTITAASPAVITYAASSATAPESGGIPPFGFEIDAPRIGLSGPVPTGLTTTAVNCDAGTCYYLCNIVGATANLSLSPACSPLINTTGSACNAGCSAKWTDVAANIYSHAAYPGLGWDHTMAAVATVNYTFRNNIVAYQSASGINGRPGGTYYNNLFLKNPIQFIGVDHASEMSYNVSLQAVSMQKSISATAYGWGTTIVNFQCGPPAAGACAAENIANPPNPGSSGTRIHHNIFGKSETSGNGIAISLDTTFAYVASDIFFNTQPTTGITVDNNIVCDWTTAANKPYDDKGVGNTLASSNKPNPQTSNVDTTCAALGIASPATAGDYYVSIGGAGGSTTDDFLSAAKTKWTKISWDERYMAKAVNAYIRPTYGISNPPDTRTVRMTVQ